MTREEEFVQIREDYGRIATEQQRKAANPLYSVWVQASAGTGKTKVLSDRVLQLLLSGAEPEQILCLTYTKAAAVEMNTRISERLSKWAVAEDAELEENLVKLLGDKVDSPKTLQKYKEKARKLFAVLLDTPGGLKIQTIHSFCQEILKRFPLEAGILPYFEVMDDMQAAAALQRIKSDMINEARGNPQSRLGQALLFMAEHMKEAAFLEVMAQIIDNLAKIAELTQKYARLEDYAAVLAQKLQVNPEQSAEDLMAEFMQNIDVAAMQKNIAALLQSGTNDVKRAEKLQALIARGLRAADYDDYIDLFVGYDKDLADFKVKALAGKKAQAVDENVLPRMQAEAERALEYNAKVRRAGLYFATVNTLVIADELNRRYQEYKRQTEQFDYTDLIVLTKKLLADPAVADWVLYKLDGRISHILVDEAQDTSADQWQIIQSLSAEFFAGAGAKTVQPTVFAVGDRKQSIFSFQGADPEKFDEMAEYFKAKATDNQVDFRKVNLEVSFRSATAVLAAVNEIFAQKEASVGVVSNGDAVKHVAFRAGEYGRVEVWPMLMPAKKDKKDNADVWRPELEMSKDISVKALMAKRIAEKIKALHTESQNSARPLKYRDFMVLVQKRSSIVTEFVRACKEIGVAVSGADKLKLSEQIAVQDLVSLGKFLLLPNDDLSLAEVLKSPLFGLTDDDLTTLCFGRGDAYLWTRLGDFAAYKSVYEQLQALLNMVDLVRPYELYNYVLRTMNGRYKFTQRMGMEVEDALDEFVNLTLAYEQKNIPSLQGFIQWIGQSEIEIKRETEQKDVDAVRVMTVHGSKGLQAPIVFLPDTVSVKNNKREQMFLWDKDLVYYPLNKAYYEDNCTQLRNRRYEKDMEEYRRLLYVALTRAEDRLYVCGYGKNAPKGESWYNLCRQGLSTNEGKEETIVRETPEVVAKKSDDGNLRTLQPCAPENWINQDAPLEEKLAKPYTPSKAEDDEEPDSSSPLAEAGDFYRRGTLIHKLLQFLPADGEDKAALVAAFLRQNAADWPEYRRQQVQDEVLSLLQRPEFADIFGENARSEVPIMGKVGDKIVSAQIDKLVILPHKIMIVDFKTNRPAAQDVAHTPAVYLSQLSDYAELIERIYPNRAVEAYILWTNEARLMRIL